MAKQLTADDISKHNSKDDLWIVIDNKVYNMTSYFLQHPGGSAILRNAGGDSTAGFQSQAAHTYAKDTIDEVMKKNYIGDLAE